MKKLMFALTVLAGASAFALTHICEGFDLADSSKWPTDTQWGIASMSGNTQNYTMSADVTKNVPWWRCLDTGNNTGCTLNVNFGGHTFTYDNANSENIRIGCGPFNPDLCACVTEFKNGVFSGGSTKPHLEVSWNGGPDWKGAPWGNSTVKFTDLVITNFDNVYFGRGYQDSQIILTNCSLTANNFRFASDNNKDNFSMTFEDTEINWAACSAWTDEGTGITENLHRKYTFTGSKTVARTWKGNRFSIGYQIPYGEILFDNGATLMSSGPVDIGYSATGKGWTVTFDHGAVLNPLSTEEGVYLGLNGSDGTLIVKNGAKIKATKMSVGFGSRGANNCTLIVSNADLSACGKIEVGGPDWDSGTSHGNKAYFCGSTTFNGWPFNEKTFTGVDGLVSFEGMTLNYSDISVAFRPVKPSTWINNELRFDNGTTATFNRIDIGQHWSGGTLGNSQKLTFGNNVTANLNTLLVAGANNVVTISNATVNIGSGSCYIGFTAYQTDAVHDNVVVFEGNHPKLYESVYGVSLIPYNNTVFRFMLPENAEYAETPINFTHVISGMHHNGTDNVKDDSSATKFEFPNINEVRAKFTGTKKIKLIQSLDLSNVSAYELANAFISGDTALPDGCFLTKEDNCLYLTLEGSKPGLSYKYAFTSIEAYNDAVTNDATKADYKDQDTYLVLKDKTFENYVDYSLFGQHDVKLHLFVNNCTFPDVTGAMYPDATNLDPTAGNRKMIALVSAKEVWVEGCTFAAYSGDSYVVDINLSNSYENDGCGITITNNTFAAGAGKRVPLSVKNKQNLPPAFVLITGNTFHGADGVAGTICFGDSPASSTTFCGANFPITIENNTFDEGTTTYKVMTGIYVTDGSGSKETINVPVDQSFKWFKVGDIWSGTPAFEKDTAKDLGNGVKASLTDDGTCTIGAASASAVTASMISSLGKDTLKSLTLGANITGVDASAFAKCYNLSSVTFNATGAVSIGANAFLRCNSLESIVFNGPAPDLGDAVTLQSAIYMKDGMPEVYTIPTVTVTGYTQKTYGTNDLTGDNWTLVTDDNKSEFHFFKVVLEKNN